MLDAEIKISPSKRKGSCLVRLVVSLFRYERGAAGMSCADASLPARRQRSEQYFTCVQSRCHFLRQVNGNRQCAQVLLGSSVFLRIFPMR